MDSSRCGSKVSGSVQMQRSQRLYQRFLTDAAAGLSFSHDCAVDPGAGSVSCGQANFRQLFRPTGALKPSVKRKTQDRKLRRPAPRPEGWQGPPGRFRDSLPLLESLESANQSPLRLQTVELLQGSRGRTSLTAVSSAGRYRVKRASGSAKPVHEAARRDHYHIIADNSSKYHKNLQRGSSPAPKEWTGPDKTAAHPNNERVATGTLKIDLTDLADQVQTAVIPSSTPTGPGPQSGSAGSEADGWMAAQCSALDGDQSRVLNQRLLAQLLLCQDHRPDARDRPPDTRLVVSLLTLLSGQTLRANSSVFSQCVYLLLQQLGSQLSLRPGFGSLADRFKLYWRRRVGPETLVRSLLAEQLNSSKWRSRLLSCNTLSSLKGPTNKDVVHKLIHLMWNDQCWQVRIAAAEALMKLGKMQDVYSELRLKLEEGQSLQDRMEALDIISHLKLKTLLEPLVSCLRDEFTAVRKQACLMAESLLLKDETVVSCLLELVENDPAQEVRLSAIRAVGALGLTSSDVQETLLHCVETEEEAELRLAACRLLQSAGVTSAQLKDFLLQRVDVESNWLVRRTMKEVLRLCVCSPQEERCNTKYISLQVKRLCERRDITEKVLLLETLRAEGSPEQSLRPGTLAKLLSQRYRTDSNTTPDQY